MQMKRFVSKTAVSLLLALSACGAPEGDTSEQPLGNTQQALTARGWDPFLTTPNAWTKTPEHRRFCQGSGCYSSLGYGLGEAQPPGYSCTVRGPGYDTYGTGGLCPNWFNWEWDASVGRWKAHIISVPGAGQSGYQYVGLEQYINGPMSAWDWNNTNHWPLVSTVHSVHVQVRARFCNSRANARLPYYFAWVVPGREDLRGQVSIDLLTYVGAPPALPMPDPGPSQTEAYLASRAGAAVTPDMYYTFLVNGASWGVTPTNFSSSQMWCYNSINDAPWLDFSINIPAILSRLQREGRVPNPLPYGMKYSGGILGGLEFWGPVGGWAEVELRDHEIWTY